MKVLIDHPYPFVLMHGGFQIQIEQTKEALQRVGVDVEYLRWWDDSQKGDFLHYFGMPTVPYVDFARQKGFKVVLSHLLTGLGSRGKNARELQKWIMRFGERFLPGMVATRFAWGTVTITERKRVVELAEAAVMAKTPLWVVGKPYSDHDAYAKRFFKIQSSHPDLIRFEGPIQDRARMAEAYREARGFVLLSTMESLSLSALEAAACGCPELLSDLPWARTVFKNTVRYGPITSDARITAGDLRSFYDAAPKLKAPDKPMSWDEVALELKKHYERLASTSR